MSEEERVEKYQERMRKMSEEKSYPERLHDIFMKNGLRSYSPIETEVALLIDEIVRDKDERIKRLEEREEVRLEQAGF